MALEFLQAEGDIPEFVGYLYDLGCILTYRCGPRRGTHLDRETAVNKLRHDLFMWGSAYLIGTPERPMILSFNSCGPDGHPSLLGNWGRIAGRIAHYNKDDPAEKELMKRLQSYFRRNYSFRRYNGDARMSCHFGPHYQAMEAAFFADPRHAELYAGYLFLLCRPERADTEMQRAEEVLKKLDIQDAQFTALPYWDDPGLTALHIPFLHHAPSFSEKGYTAALSELCSTPLRFHSGNRSFGFLNARSPEDLLRQKDACFVYAVLQRP